jgi:hypothetical protein
MLLLVLGLNDHQAMQHCHDPPHTAPPCANHRFRFGAKRTYRRMQSMSPLAVKQTSVIAAHMFAFDPKRTSAWAAGYPASASISAII